MKKALLLSGGMDSLALAYWLRPDLAITVDYGQRSAAGEIRSSKSICDHLQIQHLIITSDCSQLGSGDLSSSPPDKLAPESEWWPFRNQFIISLGAMACIKHNMKELLIGALKTDGFHADSTPEFITKMNKLLNYQEGNIILTAPAIELTASELATQSNVPSEVLAWAHSCHTSDYACGMCRGCQKHYETLNELNYAPY